MPVNDLEMLEDFENHNFASDHAKGGVALSKTTLGSGDKEYRAGGDERRRAPAGPGAKPAGTRNILNLAKRDDLDDELEDEVDVSTRQRHSA